MNAAPEQARDRRRWGLLVTIGAIAYFAAWFLPTWSPATAHETGDRKWAPGWMAFRVSWEFLTSDEATLPWTQRLPYATCLTNAVMITALPMFFVRRARVGFGIALLVCAGIDSVWLRAVCSDPNPIGAGYWLWLASFVLVGIAFVAFQPVRATGATALPGER
jgi:hypothetical protein